MSQVVEITGTTGVGPYDVYLCDITLTYCYLISGSTTIPPSVIFELPLVFQGVQSVIVKIIDLDNGCEHFNLYNCPTTPTPSPTATPTPTPTPTPMCSCISAVNSGATIGSFQYTYCNGGTSGIIPVDPYVTIYVCGNSPINPTNVTITIGDDCIDESCPPPPPIMCFGLFVECYECDSWTCSIPSTGYYNGKPYYILLDVDCMTPSGLFVWWNSLLNRWEVSDSLGGGLVYLYNNNPSNYPETDGIYSWVLIEGALEIIFSIQGTCPTPTPTPTSI